MPDTPRAKSAVGDYVFDLWLRLDSQMSRLRAAVDVLGPSTLFESQPDFCAEATNFHKNWKRAKRVMAKLRLSRHHGRQALEVLLSSFRAAQSWISRVDDANSRKLSGLEGNLRKFEPADLTVGETAADVARQLKAMRRKMQPLNGLRAGRFEAPPPPIRLVVG